MDWERFNDQFRETDEERQDRWRATRAKRKAEGKCWQCAKLIADCGCPNISHPPRFLSPFSPNNRNADMTSAEAAEINKPDCEYCGTTNGVRVWCDGGKFAFGFRIQPPSYICEDCFTGTDAGPCFDDLPEA